MERRVSKAGKKRALRRITPDESPCTFTWPVYKSTKLLQCDLYVGHPEPHISAEGLTCYTSQCESRSEVSDVRCDLHRGHTGQHGTPDEQWYDQCDSQSGFLRCERVNGHRDKHFSGKVMWDDSKCGHEITVEGVLYRCTRPRNHTNFHRRNNDVDWYRCDRGHDLGAQCEVCTNGYIMVPSGERIKCNRQASCTLFYGHLGACGERCQADQCVNLAGHRGPHRMRNGKPYLMKLPSPGDDSLIKMVTEAAKQKIDRKRAPF